MWKIIVESSVENTLKLYISQYREYFSRLYAGGGVWAEESLIETYRRSSDELYKAIRSRILERFSSNLLPYEILEDGMKKSVIFVQDRIIFLEYEEIVAENLRIIYKITITHR